jgi:hypothetical protein
LFNTNKVYLSFTRFGLQRKAISLTLELALRMRRLGTCKNNFWSEDSVDTQQGKMVMCGLVKITWWLLLAREELQATAAHSPSS